MVSHTEVNNYYKNVTAVKMSTAKSDSTSWARRVHMDELITVGKKAYKQAIVNHLQMKEETASLAALAFRKKFNLTSEFRLFQHFHCDPEFYMS